MEQVELLQYVIPVLVQQIRLMGLGHIQQQDLVE